MAFDIPLKWKQVIAKSDPELSLYEHTEDVMQEAEELLSVFSFEEKYQRLTGRSLRRMLMHAALWHDYGKAHRRWQKHVKEDNLINVGLRHELQSVKAAGTYLWPEEMIAILAHHNKLSSYHKHRWTDNQFEFDDLWVTVKRISSQIASSSGASIEEVVRARYGFNTVRGLLQLADRRASQREGHGPDPLPIHTFDYQFPEEWSRRLVQKRAEELSTHKHAALRAQTGSGKTDASLLWAQRQIEQGRAQKAIIALPTRFTSTSLSQDVQDQVTAGLYHSTAWFDMQDELHAQDALRMASQFVDPLTVCTIDQVLMALTGRSETHHVRFANLAHSALIIDEIDAYDDAVRANLEVLVDVLDMIDVPVLMMSATLPESQIASFGDMPFADCTQPGSSFTLDSVDELEDPAEIPLEWCSADRLIVYANTVKRAVGYYDAISRYRDDVVLYHSRFAQPHRAQKEERVLDMLGPSGTGGVAVMTQVGEMSLNISARAMISELCPVDRLAQRTGRMCRFDDEKMGHLRVVVPVDGDTLYPAPYGHLDDNYAWTPADPLLRTRDVIAVGSVYDKESLRDLTEEVYADEKELSGSAQENARHYVDDEIIANWLIVPNNSADAEDAGTERWSARMIPEQIDVFVRPVKDHYDSSEDFQRARLTHAISVPYYRHKHVEQTVVTVGDEEQTVYTTSDYTIERGFI